MERVSVWKFSGSRSGKKRHLRNHVKKRISIISATVRNAEMTADFYGSTTGPPHFEEPLQSVTATKRGGPRRVGGRTASTDEVPVSTLQ